MTRVTLGTLDAAAVAMNGQLHGQDRKFDAVSTDTRTIGPGQLFFALRGERFDAGEFVAEAAAKGAAGAVVEQLADADVPQITVDDTRLALGAMARKWREQFELPLIGITGSNGKTTVKELTSAIMRSANAERGADAVLATEGNLNNDIGLPLTLLRLRDNHRVAVIEMGANHPGEIAELAAIAVPNIGIITNAARAHLEGFGSIEDVALTKGGLLDGLGADDVAVLNRDDQFFTEWAERAAPARVISFGSTADADVYASDVRFMVRDDQPAFEFRLHTPDGAIDIVLPLAGRHNVMNACAAAAATLAAGTSLEQVQAGLAGSSNVAGRLRSFRSATGAMVFDDSYNANPDSVAAAIAFLADLPDQTWLVLGDMGELGSDAPALHRNIGELARDVGIHALFCTGELSRETAAGYGAGARWFATVEELGDELLPQLDADCTVLIKGSRFMALDRLVKRIEQGAADAEGGET